MKVRRFSGFGWIKSSSGRPTDTVFITDLQGSRYASMGLPIESRSRF